MIVLLLFLLHLLLLLLLFVIVPRRLAQCVTNLVLGLVVSDIRPPSRLWVLSDESDSRGGFAPNRFEYLDNDRPLVVFRPGGHIAGNVFPYQVSEHLVALLYIIYIYIY